MTTVALDASQIVAIYEKRLIDGINKALPILLKELKDLTPEDTGEMLDSYEVENAHKEGDSVVGVISNEAGYAIYVEYGVKGLAYTYHKPKGVPFFHGVGNRTFTRAVDGTRERIIQIIYNEVNK